MRTFYLFLVMLAISIVTGCASVPMTSLEEDSAAKQFQVSKYKSSIYLFRNEIRGGGFPFTVSIDDQIAGQTAANTFFKWEVAPGEHLIKSFAEDTSSILLIAKEGQAHFVRQKVKIGMWMPRSQLSEVTETEGKEAVNECKMVKSNFTQLEMAYSKSESIEVEKLKLQLEIEKLKLEQQKMKGLTTELIPSSIPAGKQ